MNQTTATAKYAFALLLLAAMPKLMAQAAAPAAPAPANEDESAIVMDPFTVSAEEDAGSYQATATLAGSRIRTDVKDVASSISIVTPEFLKNTGARNNQDLLVYTANTEVGGVFGNYAGVGGTFINGANESANFLKPNQNTRVRGLDSADNTRDFFGTDLPWDGYNVGRVDLQRGPNSILFGIGSPAGIINSSLNAATFKNGGNIENRFGSYNSLRFSMDYNYVLLPKQLSFRIAALDDNQKYRQTPAYNHDKRLYAAMRWDPKFMKFAGSSLSVKANFEHGDIEANRPRVLPPSDRISPFFDKNAINKQLFDPYYTWQSGMIAYPSTNSSPNDPNAKKNFWVVQYMGPGINAAGNPIATYDNVNSSTFSSFRQSSPGTYWGVGMKDGATYRDGGIDGFPYGSNIGIAGFNEYTYSTWRSGVKNSAGTDLYPAADKGFWKDKSLTDTSVFDFYNQLIDGPTKKEWQKWDAFNVSVSEMFFNNRVGFEFVADIQNYKDGHYTSLSSPFISVDIRKNLMVYPWAPWATDVATVNPNAGRAFIGGNSKNYGNSTSFSKRRNYRFTAFGEFKSEDYFGKNLATRILGRQVLTALYSKESYEVESRNFVRSAVDSHYSDVIGNGTYDGGSNVGGLVTADIAIDTITYLSGSLMSKDSAKGLNLSRLMVSPVASGTYTIPYYDSHWKTGISVDPAAPWINVYRPQADAPGGQTSTQSENFANYVGWTSGTFRVYNAENAEDINHLYTDVAKVRKDTNSKGITLQSYFWDDVVVGTFGWREDRQRQEAGASTASTEADNVAHTNPALDGKPVFAKGNSSSWGVVVKLPKELRKYLPSGTDVRFTYSDGRNMRVENRFDFGGNTLPNSKGRTKDVGVVLSALEDRIQLKATHYQTTVKDANLSSVTTEVSTLGSNTYVLKNLEGWGTASALLDLAGRDGGAPGWEWYWNWALVDGGWDSKYNDPTGADFKNHPSTIKQTAAINSWMSQLLPQSWFDAYGFAVNTTKAKAGDWRNAISGWTPTSGVGGLQPSGGGRIKGSWPTGTVDYESKGWEFELVGSPLKNWNVSLNASKTFAAQTALGASLVSFIEAQHAKYMTAAGDLRLWWGGDATLREYYNQNIWSAYQFQVQTNGKMVPEMAPWRFNLVNNYNFSSSGPLKGVNVGLAYRWENKHILGYGLNSTGDNLDTNKPFWSKGDDSIDAWVGYERKLTSKINWRIQLNMRNVGQQPHLIPISIQPDGSAAGFRISDGFAWTITNTFSF